MAVLQHFFVVFAEQNIDDMRGAEALAAAINAR